MKSKMKLNTKLLPIKGHYFFFNAGTAPLVPYLSTYARQLGFTSATVGLIYTVLPIFGLVAKPLFGLVADRFKIQKFIFILFQIVTIVSFSSIYVIPENRPAISVGLDCGDVGSVLRSCYNTTAQVDTCKVTTLRNSNLTTSCQFKCDMTSPKMWQTVCEHWHIPQYCYNTTDSIQYSSHVSNVTVQNNCANILADNVTLNGYIYRPECRTGKAHVDITTPCNMTCNNQKLSTALDEAMANMTCIDEHLHYQLCTKDGAGLLQLTKESIDSECQVSCNLNKSSPWYLMEICEGWHADIASSCHPKTREGEQLPANLSFVGTVLPSTTTSIEECVFMELQKITLPDQSEHYPVCVPKAEYEVEYDLFQSSCEISCDNTLVNEIFEAAWESNLSSTQYTAQFWLFFFLMITSWIGQAVVVTFADAICFNHLDKNISDYGKQRLWGSFGWGIFSLLTGVLIDHFSEGAYKNYAVAFILMLVFMSGDVAVSCFLQKDSTKMSMNILTDVGTLLTSMPTIIFLVWTIAVGLCTGLLWNFLFWLLEDIANQSCNGSDYVKTMQGLVSAIQTFGGEIPFLFVSGVILEKVGHENMMSLVLFAFGVRFILYSFVENPWLVLPIEMFQGITFGMFYPTMTSYACKVSPPGTETTVQGLVGAVFEGVGTSLGSLIGGQLYHVYGGWITFRCFGIGSLICCLLHILTQYISKVKLGHSQGYSSVRYEQQHDMVFMLEDITDCNT